MNKYLKLGIIAGGVIVLDLVTKFLIMHHMPLFSSVEVIPGFFNLTYIQNPGGAFGFLAHQGEGLRRLVFVAFSMVAILIIFFLYIRTSRKEWFLAAGLALILGGAVGNMIDRLRFGQVVDFLDFYFKNMHWPAFNIADSAITVGIGFFVLQMLGTRKK